ncbi:hypothetical protein SAMN04490195_1872 [Pseudomonas moorei]|uniref:Uncharacterized protein n=1 Tax=Pseudomonas moorei TaxID=395599 RepID=A0A1H1DT31_9PSED|nr:hypothetical protein SAMN04490195_1872 [Pseudomonas moorei]
MQEMGRKGGQSYPQKSWVFLWINTQTQRNAGLVMCWSFIELKGAFAVMPVALDRVSRAAVGPRHYSIAATGSALGGFFAGLMINSSGMTASDNSINSLKSSR